MIFLLDVKQDFLSRSRSAFSAKISLKQTLLYDTIHNLAVILYTSNVRQFLQYVLRDIRYRRGFRERWERARMCLSMPQDAGSLREILAADVAFVRPDASVSEHVLIKIARACERSLADCARSAASMFRALVTAERIRRGEHLVAQRTLEAVLVHQQMIVQVIACCELLATEVATVLVNDPLGDPVVLPLVVRDVLHDLAANLTNVRDVQMCLLDVTAKIDLQLETFAAVVAHVLRLYVAVHADVMILQPNFTLVLQVAHRTLQVRVVLVRYLVLLQQQFRRIPFVTFVTGVDLLVESAYVPL